MLQSTVLCSTISSVGFTTLHARLLQATCVAKARRRRRVKPHHQQPLMVYTILPQSTYCEVLCSTRKIYMQLQAYDAHLLQASCVAKARRRGRMKTRSQQPLMVYTILLQAHTMLRSTTSSVYSAL